MMAARAHVLLTIVLTFMPFPPSRDVARTSGDQVTVVFWLF
jgi:hypothetical protein